MAVLLVGSLIVTACSGQVQATLEPEGAPLDLAAVEQLARATDISSVSSIDVADAPDIRDEVLRDLRTRGAVGDRAATLLTRGFPPRTAAIPVLVRASLVDGSAALIVVEASGDPTGRLIHRRLWVFDATSGAVVHAAAFK
jgi:hypothetical protein